MSNPNGTSPPDPDATAARHDQAPRPAASGESRERAAAFARGREHVDNSAGNLCVPDVAGLEPELLFTLCAENVRDYAIFLTDRDGIIKCWGEGARLMKWWTRREAEGGHLRMLYPDGGSEDGTAEAHLSAAAKTGEYNGEGHRVRRDGSTFWAYVTLTALHNTRGELVGFTKVTRDFSARRGVEAALLRKDDPRSASQDVFEEATRLKRLLASLSHEVRTPLQAMLTSINLLEHRATVNEDDRSQFQRLERSGRHLLQILEDVLQISRAESGRLPVASSARRLGPAIDEAVTTIEAQAEARGVIITNAVSGSAADLPYWGDEQRVRQIVINLLTNAVKFTDRGGRVTISGGAAETVHGADLVGTGPWSYVRVEDSGRGIAPDAFDIIFEPYRQADAADSASGTGLGLSISRQLARVMGGDLTVQSEPGVGSSFTLWLPIAPASPIPR